ncbi:MAG: NTP transferase domain-containing protein [Coprobacillus sp.]|nr:NTP transferase domain-containing protein [Coprobacillus sp.]
MAEENKYVVIIAAGKGRKMVSKEKEHSKVSYPILGRPIVKYVIDAVKKLNPKEIVTVVGFGGEATSEIVKKDTKVVWQDELVGTAKAVLAAKDELGNKKGKTILIYGDMPLITSESLEKLYKKSVKSGDDLTLLSAIIENPKDYPRVVRDPKSRKILKIVAENEVDESESEITEVNTGVYVVDNQLLFKYLDQVQPNDKGKYYLSDIVELFAKDGHQVGSYILEDATEIYSVSNRVQLAQAAKVMHKRINKKIMAAGVSMEDPDSTFISPNVKIGTDTIILPNTMIIGECHIGEGNRIGPSVRLTHVDVGKNNSIVESYITGGTIGNGNKIGPYVNLKDHDIGNNEVVGPFINIEDKK